MCCSESFFNKEPFTPLQLPELSVKGFFYLLVSSSHFNISFIVSNNRSEVNYIFKKNSKCVNYSKEQRATETVVAP